MAYGGQVYLTVRIHEPGVSDGQSSLLVIKVQCWWYRVGPRHAKAFPVSVPIGADNDAYLQLAAVAGQADVQCSAVQCSAVQCISRFI
jgi:hypothetical protein